MPVVPFDPTQRILMTQGDQLPFVQATLEDVNGNAIDLAVATVRFHMVNFYPPNAVVVDGPANILQTGALNKGVVQYNWQATDTQQAGLFSAYFVITQGSFVQHYPPSGRAFIVQILPKE